MSKKALPNGYRLSRLTLESVAEATLMLVEGIDLSSEKGRERIARMLKWGTLFVHLPGSGWHMFVNRWEDGGVVYRIDEGYPTEDRKFIQKLFATARKCLASSSRQAQEIESSGEERKKGTSDVSEFVTGTSNSVHGGDSSSGEVPDGESGGGKEVPSNRSSMQNACSAPASGASEYPADASTAPARGRQDGSDSDSRKARQQQRAAAASDGAGSSGSGAALEAPECAAPAPEDGDAPQGRAGSCGEGTGGQPVVEILDGTRERSTVPSTSGVEEATPALEREEASVSFKELRKKMKDLAKSSSSVKENNSFGGVYATLAEIGVPPKELINRGRRVFARLISDLGQGEAGPRWDVRRISTRIASLQNFKPKDKKLEQGRPAIAVLPDVSGSMSRFAQQVLEFAKVLGALGVPGAEVVVIPHSNGHPLELWVNKEKVVVPVGLAGKDDIQEWYRNVFVRYHVEVVVLAADWDGEWLFRWIAEELPVKIFWCDVWSSSRLAPTVVDFPPKWAGEVDWDRSAARRVRYAFGCGNVVDFITALEKIVNGKRR